MSDIPSPVFKSSIKVKGIHFLPPIITEKQSKELQRFKQQAIKLEKRLQNCRELKKNLDELLNFQPLSERPQSVITFGDNSHIEALGIGTSRKALSPKKKINLSKDIVDVTEYSSDGIKIIKSEIETNDAELNQGHISNTSSKIIELDDSLNKSDEISLKSLPTSNEENTAEQDNQDCTVLDLRDLSSESFNVPYSNSVCGNTSPIKSRPRLIRSNSYTLEAPSPMLLAHMEKCNKQEEMQLDPPNKTFSSRHWSSLENNYIPFENSQFSSMNTVYNLDPNKMEDKRVQKNVSPRIEVIQTDISVQQITVNGNHKENEITENTFDLSNPDSQLMQVLQKVPENYSKQIIDLIEKQQADPSMKVETFKKIEKQYSDEISKKGNIDLSGNSDKFEQNKSNRTTSLGERIQESKPQSDERLKNGERSYSSAASVSPSQSLYYSVSSSGTLVPNSPSIGCIDIEYEVDKIGAIDKYSTEKLSEDIIDLYGSRVSPNEENFNRELFPQLNNVELYDLQQHWAAGVIGAHVKGYLTRRLLKTERVQSLIETIKDALLCALQLHNAENIEESDVELHRRLINQVSAACYAFHDIFFSLSIPEQMSVIASDRHRRIEKAKRPVSAPISQRSRSNSRNSSTKSSTPQSRSLTKV